MKKLSRRFRISIGFLLLFAVWVIIAPFLATNLIVEKPLEKADAIFVLSGGSAFVERTHKAAELFKNGVAPKIYLTNDGGQGGWDKKEQRNPYFYEKARWELIAQGVPESAIEVLPELVESTQDEAVLYLKAAREKNLNKILIVTSAYHTRRTLSTFEKISRQQVEIGIAAPETASPSPYIWWLSPKGWRNVAGEYLKFFYYWVYY